MPFESYLQLVKKSFHQVFTTGKPPRIERHDNGLFCCRSILQKMLNIVQHRGFSKAPWAIQGDDVALISRELNNAFRQPHGKRCVTQPICSRIATWPISREVNASVFLSTHKSSLITHIR